MSIGFAAKLTKSLLYSSALPSGEIGANKNREYPNGE
jgi:hypothetical protein